MYRWQPNWNVRLAASLLFALLATTLLGQSVGLPAPRLLTLLPMGGEFGTQVEVTLTGELLDGGTALLFSHPGITATAKVDKDGVAIPNQYVVTIAKDCPVGVYDAYVLTPFGVSSARAFSVGHLKESVQTVASTTVQSAMELPLDSLCNSSTVERSVNYYRFHANQGQRVLIDCVAKGIDSKLSPVLIVASAVGDDIVAQRRGDWIDFTAPETADYAIKVHDLTFRGGPQYFFRLAVQMFAADSKPERLPTTRAVCEFSWPPTGLVSQASSTETDSPDSPTKVESIELPCDLTGTFYPAADVDRLAFNAKKGDSWWIEVASERLGRPTNANVLVQRKVTANEQESWVDVIQLTDIDSPVKRSSNFYSYDGPPYNAGTTDVLGKLDIPDDGVYQLQLADLFGGTRNDLRNQYRLIVRKAQPDFAIVAWAMHMELRNGDRNALSKPIALRPGANMPFEVVAIRRDGFDGPIDIRLENLPEGVQADGLRIPAGSSRGHLLVRALPDAKAGFTVAKLSGIADINGHQVTRQGAVASMCWPCADHSAEIPMPRLMADIPVSVGQAEAAPLMLVAKSDEVLEVKAREKITIPILHQRTSEFSGASIRMQTMGAGFEANPAFDLNLSDNESNVVLDLAQLKPAPGDYRIAFYGGAVVKYAPKQTPDKPVDTVDLFVSKPISIRVLKEEAK